MISIKVDAFENWLKNAELKKEWNVEGYEPQHMQAAFKAGYDLGIKQTRLEAIE